MTDLQWFEQRETTPRWGPRASSVADAFRAEAEVLGRHFADDAPSHRRPFAAPPAPPPVFMAAAPSAATTMKAVMTAADAAPSGPPAGSEYASAFAWTTPLRRSVGEQHAATPKAAPPQPPQPPQQTDGR